jgi:hypothetical protein
VRQFAAQTGLEVVVMAVGVVQSGHPGTFGENLHRWDQGVISTAPVPGLSSVDKRRMMFAAASTGGPLASTMELEDHEREVTKLMGRAAKLITSVSLDALMQVMLLFGGLRLLCCNAPRVAGGCAVQYTKSWASFGK